MVDDPPADTPKLVYADWLDDHNDVLRRAEFLRLSVAGQRDAANKAQAQTMLGEQRENWTGWINEMLSWQRVPDPSSKSGFAVVARDHGLDIKNDARVRGLIVFDAGLPQLSALREEEFTRARQVIAMLADHTPVHVMQMILTHINESKSMKQYRFSPVIRALAERDGDDPDQIADAHQFTIDQTPLSGAADHFINPSELNILFAGGLQPTANNLCYTTQVGLSLIGSIIAAAEHNPTAAIVALKTLIRDYKCDPNAAPEVESSHPIRYVRNRDLNGKDKEALIAALQECGSVEPHARRAANTRDSGAGGRTRGGGRRPNPQARPPRPDRSDIPEENG